MSDDILDLIDGAINDWSTSEDAMRWAPDGEGDPSKAAGPFVETLNRVLVDAMAEADFSLTPWQGQVLANLVPGTLAVTLDNRDGVLRPAFGAGQWAPTGVLNDPTLGPITITLDNRDGVFRPLPGNGVSRIFEWSPDVEVIDESYTFTRAYLESRVAAAFGVPRYVIIRRYPMRRAHLRRMHGAYRARKGRRW